MALQGKQKNYQLGNGFLFIADIKSDGSYGPERELGLIENFNLTVGVEKYEFYGSNCGPKVKLLDIVTQTDRSGGFTLRDSTWENMAMAIGGDLSTVTHTAATVATESIASVQIGYHYPLGVTANKPLGVNAKIEDFVLEKGAATLVAGTMTQNGVVPADADYVIDTDRGVVQILGGGTVADSDTLDASYKTVAGTTVQLKSGQNVGGIKKIRFKACNTSGENRDAVLPKVSIMPSSELAFKGEEVQTLEFTLEILEPDNGLAAIIIDGRPA